jgi:dihydrofolate reductase
MRKIIVTEFITLDGVVEDPGGSEKTEHGGWGLKFSNNQTMKLKFEELFASDAQLLGRVTYDGFASAWPTMQGTGEFGERMNGMPKYVVSQTLREAEWNNSHIINGDVPREVLKLKQQPGGNILVSGSASLIQTLIQNNLIDEYRLLVFPIVLGGGKRLFQPGTQATLKLVESKFFDSGVNFLHYESARS